ncbi:uncharacterized protein LOC119531718 isoform X2 [Choloepus didactylus]|uniref:uncharacterized protein LOC119531718 isoform X2 n=1 Tax=Choloepus didactylus TaxID=27675 RepID=UPI00189F6F86|nr:uncharacterized protein LOC119531718 isoform X2 [Choloepus didactylus]
MVPDNELHEDRDSVTIVSPTALPSACHQVACSRLEAAVVRRSKRHNKSIFAISTATGYSHAGGAPPGLCVCCYLYLECPPPLLLENDPFFRDSVLGSLPQRIQIQNDKWMRQLLELRGWSHPVYLEPWQNRFLSTEESQLLPGSHPRQRGRGRGGSFLPPSASHWLSPSRSQLVQDLGKQLQDFIA